MAYQDVEAAEIPNKLPETLTTYRGVGDVVSQLTNFYDPAGYVRPDPARQWPAFLTEAVGPPLRALFSYNVKGADGPIQKSSGFGKGLNSAHREMENMGFRVASFVFPDILERTAPGKLEDAYARIPYQGVYAAVEGADTKLHLGREEAQEILLLGAVSQGFMSRPGGERDLIDDHIGNAETLFNTMAGISGGLQGALREQGLADKVDMGQFRLNIPEMQKSLMAVRPQLEEARVFIQVTKYGILTDGMCQMCWDEDKGEPRPQNTKQVVLYTPKDAASALFALSHFAERTIPPKFKQLGVELSQRLSEAPDNAEAARLLRQDEFRQALETFGQHIPNDSRHAVLTSALKALEAYRSRGAENVLYPPEERVSIQELRRKEDLNYPGHHI